jgi:hypothetical protein
MLIARLTYSTYYNHDCYLEEKGYLELTDRIEWIGPGPFKRFENSLIVNYEHSGSSIHIQAIDAEYRFEMLMGSFERESIILASPKTIEKLRKREEATTYSFHCIASPITSDARRKSVVSFTQSMNLSEAREHVQNHIIFSDNGDVVLEILTPILSRKGKSQ